MYAFTIRFTTYIALFGKKSGDADVHFLRGGIQRHSTIILPINSRSIVGAGDNFGLVYQVPIIFIVFYLY